MVKLIRLVKRLFRGQAPKTYLDMSTGRIHAVKDIPSHNVDYLH